MSLQICTRCLARASINTSFTINSIPAFPIAHATSFLPRPRPRSQPAPSHSVNPPKKKRTDKGQKTPVAPSIKGQKARPSPKRKGSPFLADKGKRPAIGERKALRKRVVLVQHQCLGCAKTWKTFSEGMMTDERDVREGSRDSRPG